MSTQQYIDDYIRQYLLAQEQKKNNSNVMDRVQNASSKIEMAGKGLDALGGLMSKVPVSGINTLGNGLQNIGGNISDVAGKVSTAIGNLSGVLGSGAANAGASAAGTAAASGASGGAAAGGPIGALVGLGISALQGNKRNAAKNAASTMLKANEQQNEALMQEADMQQAQNQQALNNIVNNSNTQPIFTGNSNPLPDQILNNLQNDYGYITGGAAPVEQNTPIQKGAVENQSLLSKLASGAQDFIGGFQENRNNEFKPENLTSNQLKIELPNNQLQNYQQSLLDKGVNQDVVNAVAEGKNSGNKEIAKWINDNPQAYKPTVTGEKEKGNMARVGEALGTVARIAQNPGVQGAIAGITGGALSGNPLYGVGLGYKIANQRANSNVYNDFLKDKFGLDTNTGIFGNTTSSDVSNFGKIAEDQAWHEYMKNKYDTQNQLAERKLDETVKQNEIKNKQKETQLGIQQQNANSNSTKAKAATIRAKNSGKGKSGKSTKNSNQYVAGKTPGNIKVKVPVNQVKEFKANGGKIVG